MSKYINCQGLLLLSLLQNRKAHSENKAEKSCQDLPRVDQHPNPTVEGLALLQPFPGGEEMLPFPGVYSSKRETAEICVTLMGSVIAGQNTAMLESIYQRYDRASQLCCLSNPLLNRNVQSDRTLYLINITGSCRLSNSIFKKKKRKSYSKVT